ncbi:hypothetical protein ACNOYE_05265 [Nannocystaceae bacterium ST9]
MLRRFVLVLPLLALACPAAPSEPAAASGKPQTAELASSPSPATPSEPTGIEPAPVEPASAEPAPVELAEPIASPPPVPDEPSDELAPELPKGPEPGSAEADAELLKLLDESTITQDEFAKAFGNGKAPKIDEEGQFAFGAGERTRERSQVSVGKPTISAGKVAASEIETLAKQALPELEACHAMALSKDASELGKATLVLVFDGAGEVETVTIESTLGRALTDCLGSVAKGWVLAGASGAKVRVPLSLSTQ